MRNPNILRFLRRYSSKNYLTVYETDFNVTPFCKLKVKGNFHLNVRPLDVHNYMNSDKVFIKFLTPDKNKIDLIDCSIEKDGINVIGNVKDEFKDLVCDIEAPVKANVEAEVDNGTINLCNFQGDNLHLKSNIGDISVENCLCENIQLNSIEGNIICKKNLQAKEIYLQTGKFGNIIANKLQGISLMASTINGDIRTQSTYFDNSYFSSEKGSLYLSNAHRNCKIFIKSRGNLDLVRFDGILDAILNEGTANIQLSRIEGNSDILIEEDGKLNLKLFEGCQQDLLIKIIGKDIRLNDNVLMTPIKEKNVLLLKGENNKGPKLTITAEKSAINIDGVSISDLFSKSLKK